MLISIGFLLLGLFLAAGGFIVVNKFFFCDDRDLSSGSLSNSDLGVLLGGILMVLGIGGIYFELKAKSESIVEDQRSSIAKQNSFSLPSDRRHLSSIHDGPKKTSRKSTGLALAAHGFDGQDELLIFGDSDAVNGF